MTEAEKIGALEPGTREHYLAYRQELATLGIEERVLVTIRTPAAQKEKWNAGRSSQKIGWHQLARAIDRQLRDGDKWDDKARNVQLYLRANRIAEKHGFRQIGFHSDGKKRYLVSKEGRPYWDPYHIEYRHPYGSLALAIRAEAPDYTTLLG